MEIVEVPVTYTVDEISVQKCTAGTFRVFRISEHRESDVVVRIEKSEDPKIRLPDISPSHVTSLCASLCIYDFDYFRGTLSDS